MGAKKLFPRVLTARKAGPSRPLKDENSEKDIPLQGDRRNLGGE